MIQHVPFPSFRWGKKNKDAAGQTQAFPWLVLGITMLVLLTLLSLYQSSQADAARQRIKRLQGHKMALEQQNAQLVQEINTWEDLNWLLRRADELGFVTAKPDQITYLPIRGEISAKTDLSYEATQPGTGTPWQRWLSQVRDTLSAVFANVLP